MLRLLLGQNQKPKPYNQIRVRMRVKVREKRWRDEKEEEVIDKGNEFHKQYKTAESTEVSAPHRTKASRLFSGAKFGLLVSIHTDHWATSVGGPRGH